MTNVQPKGVKRKPREIKNSQSPEERERLALRELQWDVQEATIGRLHQDIKTLKTLGWEDMFDFLPPNREEPYLCVVIGYAEPIHCDYVGNGVFIYSDLNDVDWIVQPILFRRPNPMPRHDWERPKEEVAP